MAKIINGIYGAPSGKLGGVTWGKWKGVAYGKAYAKPSNPNSLLQQAQRTKMQNAVAFARPLIPSVLNPLYDPFLSGMSAYNKFISLNIAKFTTEIPSSIPIIGEGTLFPAVFDAPSALAVDNITISVSFKTEIGYNGLAGDKVTATVYNQTTGVFSHAAAPVERSAGTIDITADAAINGKTALVFLFTYRVINGVNTMVSTSQGQEVTFAP